MKRSWILAALATSLLACNSALADPDKLLDAVGLIFARTPEASTTNSDRVSVIDRAECVFRIAPELPSENPEIYHLRNIVDPLHVKIEGFPLSPRKSPSILVVPIELVGSGVVYERLPTASDQLAGSTAVDPSTQQAAKTTVVPRTFDVDTIRRAWRYIFTHGCGGPPQTSK